MTVSMMQIGIVRMLVTYRCMPVPVGMRFASSRRSSMLPLAAARQRKQQISDRGTFVPLAFVPGEAFQFDW